ncbi:uncharacterized protein [Argopecten irradians]|uniref:uncharacterized protein n=1 Tax=Argopecten irradians TaxID=31199 RepID=UPI0037188D35
MNHVLLFAIVTLMTANHISALCLQTPQQPGEPDICHFDDKTYKKGEKWDTDNCMECTCGSQGSYSCCGYGLRAGIMNFGEGCKVIEFDCLNGIVWKDDCDSQCENFGKEIHLTRRNN